MTWVIYFLWSCVDGQVTNFRGLSQSSHFPMSVFWVSDISHVILVSGLQLLCPQFPGFTGGSSKYNWPRYQNLSFWYLVHQFTMCNSILIKWSKHQIINTVHGIPYVSGNQAKITLCCQMSLVVQYFLKRCWTQIYNPTCNPTVPDLHIHIDDWVKKK